MKQPVSCLVVVHAGEQVLLMERTDHPGFWQSVTGSWEPGETLRATAQRELFEETGLIPDQGIFRDCWWANQYEIYPSWRHRYAPGVRYNTEHVFAFSLSECLEPKLSAREHLRFEWLRWQEAAVRVSSPSNQWALEWVCGH